MPWCSQPALSRSGSVRRRLALTTWRSVCPMAADRNAGHPRLQDGCKGASSSWATRDQGGKLTCIPHDPCCAAPESLGTASAATAALLLLAGGGTAYAYWATTGAGSGAATAAAMQAVTVDASAAGDGNRTSLAPGAPQTSSSEPAIPTRSPFSLLGVLQRDGQRRCGPCRMHHHRGVLHGSCCAAACRHDPGAFFPAGHTAGRGEHVRAVTIRLPGRDLQSSRHRGGRR